MLGDFLIWVSNVFYKFGLDMCSGSVQQAKISTIRGGYVPKGASLGAWVAQTRHVLGHMHGTSQLDSWHLGWPIVGSGKID